jgi:ADP-heptose:LPS heptosyltransferase
MQNTKSYNISPDKVKNILIVRQHHQLGDMLCALPMFAAIRKKFPDAHITLIASPISYEILRSPANPYIDEVINYNKQTALHILKFFKNLTSRKYDIGIVPSTASISRTSHYINYIAGAGIRVGVESIENKINNSSYLLNIKKKFFWNENKPHQTERNLDIGRLIDCDITPEERKYVRIFLDQSETEYANKYYNDNFPDKSRPVLAFHPGAAKINNRWSKDNFIKLMVLLYKECSPYLCLTSGPIDKEITDSIMSELSRLNVPCLVIEKSSIRKESALIEKAALYVTNDTGMMHVASYVNAYVIALFGPTKGYEWGPLNERGHFIQSSSSEINNITVKQVFELSKSILENENKI